MHFNALVETLSWGPKVFKVDWLSLLSEAGAYHLSLARLLLKGSTPQVNLSCFMQGLHRLVLLFGLHSRLEWAVSLSENVND